MTCADAGERAERRGRLRARIGAVSVAAVLLVAACGPSNSTVAPASQTPAASPIRSVDASARALPSPTPSPTQSPTPSPSPYLDTARQARLQAALDAALVAQKLPGISVAMTFPDGTTWSSAVGVADRATKRPMTSATEFSAGSLTKTFVAALVMRLAEEGILTLDDPLALWIPSYPNGTKITIRQLLNHSSGIRDFAGAPGFDAAMWAAPGRTWTPAALQKFLGPPYFAPGAGWHYSNENYVLLGQVIEKASRSSVAALLQAGFFDPLGLSSTVLQGTRPLSQPLAHGYQSPTASRPAVDITGASIMLPFPAVATAFGTSGALASTAPDLARWVTLLYGDDVLSTRSRLAMENSTPTASLKGARPYGLGTEAFPIDGHAAYGHHGHLIGFWTVAAYVPDVQVGIAVMTNGDWADPTAIANQLLRADLAPAPTPAPAATPSPAAATPAAPSASPSGAPGSGDSPVPTASAGPSASSR